MRMWNTTYLCYVPYASSILYRVHSPTQVWDHLSQLWNIWIEEYSIVVLLSHLCWSCILSVELTSSSNLISRSTISHYLTNFSAMLKDNNNIEVHLHWWRHSSLLVSDRRSVRFIELKNGQKPQFCLLTENSGQARATITSRRSQRLWPCEGMVACFDSYSHPGITSHAISLPWEVMEVSKSVWGKTLGSHIWWGFPPYFLFFNLAQHRYEYTFFSPLHTLSQLEIQIHTSFL